MLPAARLESPAVLVRGDEGFDHLGGDEVAAKLVELREPEVVAVEVRVRQVVRVALQIAEILQEHEGPVELALLQGLTVGHRAQRRRTPRRVARAESRDGRLL